MKEQKTFLNYKNKIILLFFSQPPQNSNKLFDAITERFNCYYYICSAHTHTWRDANNKYLKFVTICN